MKEDVLCPLLCHCGRHGLQGGALACTQDTSTLVNNHVFAQEKTPLLKALEQQHGYCVCTE